MNTIKNKQVELIKKEIDFRSNNKSVYSVFGLREGVNKFYITHSFTRKQFIVKQDKNNQWYIYGFKNDNFTINHPLNIILNILNKGGK